MKKKHNIDNRTQTLTIFAKTTWTHLQNQICSVLFTIPTETISQKWPTIDVPNIHTLLAFSNARPKLCWFWWPGTKRFGDGSSPEHANVLVTRDSMWLISIIQGDLIWRSLGSHNSGLASNLSKLLHVTTKNDCFKKSKNKVAKVFLSIYLPDLSNLPLKKVHPFLWKPWPWVTIATIQQLHSCRKRFLTKQQLELWLVGSVAFASHQMKLWGKKFTYRWFQPSEKKTVKLNPATPSRGEK